MASKTAKSTIHLLNGPNLNLLGTREPEIYGTQTLSDIEAMAKKTAQDLNLGLVFRQTNSEGTLIDQVHTALTEAVGLIINPGAYTHTSIALHDALLALSIPKIELHLSNIHAREPFRRQSYAGMACDGVICGFGANGYRYAIEAMNTLLSQVD